MSLSLYPIIKELGDGGFGKTFLATNTLLPGRPNCVVKQLKPVGNDPQLQQLIRERFEREAIILEGLADDSSGSIPRLYAYFVEQGEFYLVQEYVDGQTLSDRVRTNGLFTEIQVRDLLKGILPTLTYVHSRGIVHRDIKPDNIMLRHRDNKPILIDFGAVKETMGTVMTNSRNSARSIVIGTPGFMPVEQMAGRPMYTSDIYALGLTIIYVLTGKMPAEIETDPSTGNINWQPYALNISSQMVSVINRAIQPLSNQRFINAQEMLNALSNSYSVPPLPIPQTPTPTVVAPLPNNSQNPTVYSPPPPQQFAIQPTNLNRANAQNPLIAAMIGVGVGGVLIALGLVLGKNFSTNNASINNDKPPAVIANANSETAKTNNTISNNTSNPPSNSGNNQSSQNQPNNSGNNQLVTQPNTSTNTNQPPQNTNQQVSTTPASGATTINNSSRISNDAAVNTVKQWLAYKRVLLAPPYDKAPGADLLVDKAYRNNIDRSSEPCGGDSDDCLSSVDWLKRYNAQYSFGVQRVDKVDQFEASGDTGTIFVTVTEFRTLHKTGGRTESSGGTKQARYDLKFDNGRVKIADYKVLN